MASIEDRGKGYVGDRYRVRWRDPLGKTRTKTYPAKKDAIAFAHQVEVDMSKGTYVDPRAGDVTFDERYKVWLAGTNLRPSSRARDESYYRSLIKPTFGAMRLRDINHDVLRAWNADLTAGKYKTSGPKVKPKPKAPATVHKAHQIVSKVLADAVEARLIPVNPADAAKGKKSYLPTVEMEEQHWLDADGIENLANVIDSSRTERTSSTVRYRTFVLVAGYCGLRLGEMIALRVGHLDLHARRIDVTENVTEVRGTFHVGPPKTKAGKRRVPIPASVVEELRTYIEETGKGPGDLLWTAPNGGYIRASLFRRRVWAPAVKAAGVEDVRIHDLRHSACSLWVKLGADPKTVAVWAGHSKVQTVLDRYVHPGDGDSPVTAALDDARATARPLASVTAIG